MERRKRLQGGFSGKIAIYDECLQTRKMNDAKKAKCAIRTTSQELPRKGEKMTLLAARRLVVMYITDEGKYLDR